MFSVALVGADGAGKTTISRRLEELAPFPVKYLYMGINAEASNHSLPTTRLVVALNKRFGKAEFQGGPPDPARKAARQRSRNPFKRAWSALKSCLRLCNQILEEWYRQWIAWRHKRSGKVVVFDRHYFADYFAHDIAANHGRGVLSRVHGFLLNHLYPRPDLVILLDAPAEVLFARKREGTLELIESRRREYFVLKDHVKHFTVIDASRPVEEVADEVVRTLRSFRDRRAERSLE